MKAAGLSGSNVKQTACPALRHHISVYICVCVCASLMHTHKERSVAAAPSSGISGHNESSSPILCQCGQVLSHSPYVRASAQTETLKRVSQSNGSPASRAHKRLAGRGEASGRAPARLYGGTESAECSAATLHGSTIQSP